jgi:DNA-binding transcriptional LysR family regulator
MALPPTTLERLRVFHAVVSVGTIAGAARMLDYTPSAVSQHVAALEREATVALVERSNRGVAPTAAGRLLAGHAADILDRVRNAFAEIAVGAAGHEIPITVAGFPSAITAMLLPARERLAPGVRLIIVDAEAEAALDALRVRAVDCAVTDGYVHDHRADQLHRTVIRVEPFRLVTRLDRCAGALAAYADADWVLARPDSRMGAAARQLCETAGFTPRVITETDDHHVTFRVVQATGAVSMLPELALGELPGDLVVDARVDIALERRIELVTRPSLRSNPGIVALAALLASEREDPRRLPA